MAVRLGLDLAQQRMSWDELASRARFADDLGFDGIWGFDHFQPMYGDGVGECFEGMTTLAALGGITERVRLGLLVTGVTYRHPSVFAAEAMTIDQSTHGRLELSLGAAWWDPEHHQLGIPFPATSERIERLDEALTIVKGLMTTPGFTFEGRHFQLRDATVFPPPVQRPHPPIWIGASGERKMLPLVARHADVWHCFGDVAELSRKAEILDDLATGFGREPGAILRAGSLSISEPWPEVRANAQALRDAGLGYLVVGWPTEGRSRLEEFWTTVAPDLLAD